VNALSSRTTRLVAATVAVAWIATAAGSAPALAAGADGVSVVNTETVQVYMNSAGKVDSQRIYEQLDLTGHGKVDLRNPVATKGLRNLDGFSSLDVVGHDQIVKTSVDGSRRLRSVSDFTGTLPLKVAITYKLDGKLVKPGQVVGKSGKLSVQFEVENVTSTEQEVSYADGKGGTVTKTVEVPLPIVGSLSTVAPPGFTNVESDQANLAGDGEGGTKLSFTMTLFPPIGSTKATFGYTADIKDGVVPQVEISALPVNPLESPTFKSAADSYQGGADTGTQLTAGASEIDSNLLKLRDGAADLLAGLIKLHDGANQLRDGLGDAAPGAARLADGAGKAYDGSKQLAAGSGQLSDGLGKAKRGAGDLKKGAAQLATGQKSLADGLKQLHDGVSALPAQVQQQVNSDPAYQALTGALTAVIQGIGTLGQQPAADPNDNSLLSGLLALKYGVKMPAGAPTDCTSPSPTHCGVVDGIDTILSGLSAATGPGGLGDTLTTLIGTYCPQTGASAASCVADFSAFGATLNQKVGDVVAGLTSIKNNANTKLVPGFDQMRAKVSTGADPATCQKNPAGCGALEALQAVLGGIPQLVEGLSEGISQTLLANIGTGAKGCDPTTTLMCGANALVDGSGQLKTGAGQLASGVDQLDKGGSKLSSGAGDLADGLRQLDDGAGQLATGLQDAKDGSGQLADGLGQAADGAPQLVDGSERLSTEGTKKLVEAGESTAQNYGEMVAVMDAGAKRAQTEDMANGAPADALGLTAYSYVIKGEDGEGGRNLARGFGAVVILAAGAGVLALRRRFV
jgi:putative membrane protein